jgi:hypothetical protein
VGKERRALGALGDKRAEIGPYAESDISLAGSNQGKEKPMSIITILIIVILVLLALYLFRRVF